VALFLMLVTWTAGLLGHLHFRKTKISRTTIPQKSHRILGPLTVSVGLLNGILGFRFAGSTHGIIGYIAMMTPAAQNFRQGQAEGVYVPPQDEAAMPLHDYRTEYAGAGGDIGAAHGPPPTYSSGYYAPPPGRPV
jgi:hypothetical protein